MVADAPPPRPGQVCHTCRHWRPRESGAGEVGWGQCRRLPPTMPPLHEEGLVHVGVWPYTQALDWCGEWSERDPPAE